MGIYVAEKRSLKSIEKSRSTLYRKWVFCEYTRKKLVASLSTSCNSVVILSSCYKGCHSQLVDKLLNCRTITSCCNKSVELNNLVPSCRQAVDNLLRSLEQAVRTHPVDKLLEQQQVCYNWCVLCVYSDFLPGSCSETPVENKI
jgi:hypothetical protein